MADQTVTLTPDSTVFDDGDWFIFGAEPTFHQALADLTDSTGIFSSGVDTAGCILSLSAGSIPADATIKNVEMTVRWADSGGTQGASFNFTIRTDTPSHGSFNRTPPDPGGLADYVQNFALQPDGAAWDTTAIDGLNVALDQTFAAPSAVPNVYRVQYVVTYNRPPTVTVTAPTGTISTTNRPDVTWSYNDPDSDAQSQYHIKIFTEGDYQSGGFDPDTWPAVWDSGATAGSATTVQAGSSLPANTNMKAYVRVHDGTQWSDWDDGPVFDITASGLDKPGRVFFAESSGPGSAGAGFFEFDDSNREGSFSFKTAPLRDPSGRQVEIREVQVYAKSYDGDATVTITVNGTAKVETMAIPGRHQLSFRFRERGETLDVKVESSAGNTATAEAPSIEALRIGWRPGHALI